MQRWRSVFLLFGLFILSFVLANAVMLLTHWLMGPGTEKELILDSSLYQDTSMPSLFAQLKHRIAIQPFNLVATCIFILAITHTLLANRLHRWADRMNKEQKNLPAPGDPGYGDSRIKQKNWFAIEMTYFLGEVEVIFGLWVIPLFLLLATTYSWPSAVHFLDGREFTEPLFVIVIMTLASSYPIVRFAETCLSRIASIGGGTPRAWWVTLLTVGPPMGSLITEPAAMTLTALLLGKHFYSHRPSSRFAYATIGLLFVNISVGGVLTHFAAPPTIMVAKKWDWSSSFMLGHFGIKAIIGILIANSLYYFIFRKEFSKLSPIQDPALTDRADKRLQNLPIPPWITIIQLLLLVWAVYHSHYPALFLSSFLFYLGFQQATQPFQNRFSLRGPLLVGFFLAALLVHVSLQGWWIEALLPRLGELPLMTLATTLTAFTDNAALTALASLIPNFAPALKYAVVSGAVIGGGLTVIANAPNPAGQVLLQRYFPKGIQPVWLFCAALTPTLIMLASFYLLRNWWFF